MLKYYIKTPIGAFKVSALFPKSSAKKKDGVKKRKVNPRNKVYSRDSYFTLRENVEFGLDDPQYELTVKLCDCMDAEYFTEDVCNELLKIPTQLKERLLDIAPDLQLLGVLEGGHFGRKVTPFHYHFMLGSLTIEEIIKIENYCQNKFVKYTLEPINNVDRYKNYLCKRKDKRGYSCKLSKVPAYWKGEKFLQKMIKGNLSVKKNIMMRVRSKVDTAKMRVSIGFKFVFNSLLDHIQNTLPLNFNRYKREYHLKPKINKNLEF